MARAEITTPSGIRIKLDGTSKEIAEVLDDLQKKEPGKAALKRGSSKKDRSTGGRPLLVDHIASLIDSGFFKKPRDLASIKSTLAEMGHHYPVTTLSPTMLRQVRRKRVRRMREKNRWLYVQ